MTESNKERVWLISGCSTGFGRDLAELVLAKGEKVVATARNPDTIAHLAEGHEARCLVLPLDVTRGDQIEAVVAAALDKFGHIDVLVNNAGYGYLAPIEEGDEAEYRKVFETNVFGLIALTRAALPGMRERRRGHIINLSSVAGFVGFASSGFYAGTKFAVEGISESLAAEVKPFGIAVTIVEPSAFRTDFTVRSLQATASTITDYAATADSVIGNLVENAATHKGDPKRGVAAIYETVNAPEPPLRLMLGSDAVKLAKMKIASWSEEVAKGEAIAASADYPDA
ncbi:MAG: oxidoreductase [Porticoccaceae bacterium]